MGIFFVKPFPIFHILWKFSCIEGNKYTIFGEWPLIQVNKTYWSEAKAKMMTNNHIQSTYVSWNESMEIQLSEGWHPINWFFSTTFLCLSQTIIWISNTIYCGLFLCSMVWGERLLFICWYCCNCWPSLFKLSFLNDRH